MVTTDTETVAVECRNLWKIFGLRAREALAAARSGEVDKEQALAQYDCVIGVADASFTVRKGEIFCIMGLSGSGKSTVIRHVNRLIEPTAGTVYVDNQEMTQLSAKALRAMRASKIGMVFQHMALWPHKTIAQNVAFGLEVQRVDKPARQVAAERALERVGLSGWGKRYPSELSGGMQQRVGLARAMAADPDILLMDEPFSALDPLIRHDLQNEFLKLARQVRKTTLFITHDLDEAMRMGDRIAIMKDGRIVQTGTPESIVLKPKTDYVARFVAGISTLKYLSATEIMRSEETTESSPGSNTTVGPSTPLPELVRVLSDSVEQVSVTDGNTILGHIGRTELLKAVRSDLARN